jgi:hypothetical protein
MRWTPGRRSDNLEDRRASSGMRRVAGDRHRGIALIAIFDCSLVRIRW